MMMFRHKPRYYFSTEPKKQPWYLTRQGRLEALLYFALFVLAVVLFWC